MFVKPLSPIRVLKMKDLKRTKPVQGFDDGQRSIPKDPGNWESSAVLGNRLDHLSPFEVL